MLGWNISVYRLTEKRRAEPATFDSECGERLAVWQTGLGGLAWINELVAVRKGIDLGGNGYPCRYTARARDLVPQIVGGPPGANVVWGCDAHDILGPGWAGKTVIGNAAIEACRPDEWLLIEAFDES